ncbi:MAG: hypothetical protein AAFR13_07040, partial [Pseudomonadota bacterium]
MGFYFSRRDSAVFAIDMLLCAACFWLAHSMIWPPMQPINEVFVWLYSLTFGVMCAIATLATGVNGSAWRFTSLPELVGLLRACVGAALLLTLLVFFFNRGTALPRSVPFLAATFSFVMMGGVRVAYRMSR